MRHPLSKTEYLAELNSELAKRSTLVLDFDTHMVLVEEDWACVRAPEDVAQRIAEGSHLRVEYFKFHQARAAAMAAE